MAINESFNFPNLLLHLWTYWELLLSFVLSAVWMLHSGLYLFRYWRLEDIFGELPRIGQYVHRQRSITAIDPGLDTGLVHPIGSRDGIPVISN